MYKKFIQAITWNSINIFLYKAILLTHQVVLFYFIPKSMYGTSGALFATIYMIIGLTGFGFDYSLFSYFAEYSKNQSCFKKLIPQYIVRLITIIVVASLLYAIYIQKNHPKIISFLIEGIPLGLLPYLLLIFVSESFKRSLETLAQLAFLNKKITKIQVSMILLYVILFWGTYAINKNITLHNIFVPMVIISYLEIIFLYRIIKKYYHSLSKDNSCHDLYKRTITKNQIYNYINQVSKNFFSPNFLMLIIAYNLGMHQAGTIRFFTNIITLLYMLLHRSVSVPSGALLSNMTKEAFVKIKEVFLTVTNTYIQFLYALAITFAITIIPHVIANVAETSITYHILLFIIAGFTEYLTLTYEKLYITQNASNVLFYINIISVSSLFIILSLVSNTYQPLLLIPIICIRIMSACSIGIYAYRKWQIRPNLSILPQTLYVSFALAAILQFIINR